MNGLFNQGIDISDSLYQSLPEKERKTYELYYVKGISQKEIASLFHMTQGAISQRISKLYRRLNFLKELHENFDIDYFDNNIRRYFSLLDAEIMVLMLKTTCQSETANRLNDMFNLSGKERMTQVKVRHRFHKSIDKLRFIDKKYYRIFKKVNENTYLLHELKLPHFKGDGWTY